MDQQLLKPKKRKDMKNFAIKEESLDKNANNSANISKQLAGLMRIENGQKQLIRRLYIE